MDFSGKMLSGLIFTILVIRTNSVDCKQFDVLKISNVPFPMFEGIIATSSAPYHKNITEFTLCYRLQVESFNNGEINVVLANKEEVFSGIGTAPAFYNVMGPDRGEWKGKRRLSRGPNFS